LVRHAQQQDRHISSLHETVSSRRPSANVASSADASLQLHRVRLRAVSALTSQRTTSHASLTAAQLSAARQAVELEGLRSQARMLGLKLARAEARADEVEHARARSVDEELRWADTMRNHTGAWAQQQAARAQAALGPRTAQKTPASAPIGTTEASPGALAAPFELGEGRSSPAAEPAAATGSNMDAESAPAGLGIRDSGMPAIETQATVQDPIEATLSPLSSIVRERNKLLSDKRHLKSRVREVEAQREVLEKELRALRPLLISGGTKVVSTEAGGAADESGVHSTPGRVKRSTSRRRRGPTMGDAEAEHLLLAARRMREVRRGDGHTSTAGSPQKRSAHAAEQARFEDRHALDDGRPRTPPPGMAPRTPQTPRTPRHVNGPGSVRPTPRSIGRTTGGLLDATMESAGARPFAGPRWAGPHERNESAMSSASFAASTGIDELLHAAQSVFTPGERGPGGSSRPDGTQVSVGPSSAPYFPRMTPSSPLAAHEQLAPQDAFESPKRRRVSSAAFDMDRQRMGLSLSPDKRAGATFGGRRVRTSTEGADPTTSGLSALDLLADQAAASQVPSQSSDRSQHSDGAGGTSDEGMAVEDPRWPARPVNDAYHLGERVRGARFGGPPPFPGPLLQHPPSYGYPAPPPVPGPQPWLASPTGGAPRVLEYAPIPYPPRPVTPPPQVRHMPSEPSYSRDDSGVTPVQEVQSSPAKSKGGNTSPDKRLPYIRWSEEEDRKLRRAISEHGQR
jgi:hypothetical protein